MTGVQTCALPICFPVTISPRNYLRFDLEADVAVLLRADADYKANMDQAMDLIAYTLSAQVDSTSRRPVILQAYKQLIITGNVCLYVDVDTGDLKMYTLRDYSVVRGMDGKVCKLVVRDYPLLSSLTEEVQAQAKLTDIVRAAKQDESFEITSVEMYTVFTYVDGFYVGERYINGVKLSTYKSKFPVRGFPYIVLRFQPVSGEDYGRSYVEDYAGTISSLIALVAETQAGIASDARAVVIISPGTAISTNVEALANARSGDIVLGEAADIGYMQSKR